MLIRCARMNSVRRLTVGTINHRSMGGQRPCRLFAHAYRGRGRSTPVVRRTDMKRETTRVGHSPPDKKRAMCALEKVDREPVIRYPLMLLHYEAALPSGSVRQATAVAVSATFLSSCQRERERKFNTKSTTKVANVNNAERAFHKRLK